MILVIGALILLAFAFISFAIFDKKECFQKLQYPAIFALLVGGAIILTFGLLRLTNPRESNMDEYKELMIYNSVIQTTDNEYAKFDYYNKVCDWNERYDNWLNNISNPWISWFVTGDYEGCSHISFTLDSGDEQVYSPPTGVSD